MTTKDQKVHQDYETLRQEYAKLADEKRQYLPKQEAWQIAHKRQREIEAALKLVRRDSKEPYAAYRDIVLQTVSLVAQERKPWSPKKIKVVDVCKRIVENTPHLQVNRHDMALIVRKVIQQYSDQYTIQNGAIFDSKQ